MTKIIEFNIPTTTGIEKARGTPVLLKVGDRKIKFVLQYDDDGKPRWLTHYASGYKVGSLNNAETELVCTFSPYHRFAKRKVAEFLIDKVVTALGVEKVLAKIDSVPVIN